MNVVLFQLHLLTAALSVVSAAIGPGDRSRFAAILQIAARALAAADAGLEEAAALADRLQRIRAQVEALAAHGAVTAEALDAALTRVEAASAAFRIAAAAPP